MGIVSFLNKHKEKKENKKIVQTLNGYLPIFNSFGQDIYTSDVVQQAIRCIASEMSKLSPKHIKRKGQDVIPINSDIQRLLDNPNELMTTSDFLFKITWNLYRYYNSYIIPTYNIEQDINGNQIKKYTGLYPIVPSNIQMVSDATGRYYYWLQLASGYETTLPISDVIHLRYNFSAHDYKGGNAFGEPDNKALLKTLDLNNTLLEGTGKALKSSYAINGIVKYNTLLDEGKTDTAIKELEEHLKNDEYGFLPIDLNSEYIPLQRQLKTADPSVIKFIDEKILRNFGVSIPVLSGNATKEELAAFYQETLETQIISFGQAFTKGLFTLRERRFTNEIVFYPKELLFTNETDKVEVYKMLVDTASCFKNELRTGFGMMPITDFAGQLAISSQKNYAMNNEKNGQDSTPQNEKENSTINGGEDNGSEMGQNG